MRTHRLLVAAAVTAIVAVLSACSTAQAPIGAGPLQEGSPSPSSSRTPTPSPAGPATYRTTVAHRGTDHPDDLALDASGALLYSDYTDGTISRLAADGTVTVLHRGLDGPEGLVPLADGTLVVAEENTNRVLAYAPGATTPRVLRRLPGTPTTRTCHQGVDGIAWDPTSRTLVVPDPVTGAVYRLSTDGRTLTRISTGFVHPVGAVVDAQGSVYVADECGGDVWRLGPAGQRTRWRGPSCPTTSRSTVGATCSSPTSGTPATTSGRGRCGAGRRRCSPGPGSSSRRACS
jgi:sugar lactone lactonase YvrE